MSVDLPSSTEPAVAKRSSCGWPLAAGETAAATCSGAVLISVSSGESGPSRAAAGGAWQGRRSAGIPLGFQGSRTPPGGDQRSIQRCRGPREGALEEPPLLDGHLEAVARLRAPAGHPRTPRRAPEPVEALRPPVRQ